MVLKRELDERGRGRAPAVVEVDHPAVNVERGLDLAPEVFVLGDVGGAPAVGVPDCRENARERVALECGERRAGGEQRAQEVAASGHQEPRMRRRIRRVYARRFTLSTNVPSTICTPAVNP